MKKLIVVTGYESSGSVFTAKIISFVMKKCKRFGDWSGYGWNGKKGDNLVIIHRSMPYKRKPKMWLADFEEEIAGMNNYYIMYVICTRDLNISKASRLLRFGGNYLEYKNDDAIATEIFEFLIQNQTTYIFSYETAVCLSDVYYQLLYQWLGVSSKFSPPIYDANQPYVKFKNLKIFYNTLIRKTKLALNNIKFI